VAGGYPPNVLQPTEAYCTNPAVIPLPPSSPEALHIRRRDRPLLARGGNMGEKCPIKFSLQLRLPQYCWVLLHAAKLRHGTDSPPKEGMLRIFSPEKSDVFRRVWTRELGYQRPYRVVFDESPLSQKVQLFLFRPVQAQGVPVGWGFNISTQLAHAGGKSVWYNQRDALSVFNLVWINSLYMFRALANLQEALQKKNPWYIACLLCYTSQLRIHFSMRRKLSPLFDIIFLYNIWLFLRPKLDN
jgi:hypothetical protein